MRFIGRFIIAAIPICLVSLFVAQAEPTKTGKELYNKKCAACHGKDGKGKAPMVKILKTEPALLDITDKGTQKTSDAEMNKIILEGQGKMKATKVSAEESQLIVDYVRTLAGPAKASSSPMKKSAPKKAKASFDKEKTGALFMKKCASCHGPDGKGKDKMATMLKIEKAQLDLTDSASIKKSDAEWLKITEEGKGKMPKYKGKLKDSEIKELNAYSRSLAGQ